MSNQKSQHKIKYIFIGNKSYEVINGFTIRMNNTMNKEQAKRMLPIIKAFSEGMQIQIKCVDKWETLTEGEGLPINTLTDEPNNFRIKPKPKYRPFANTEECWQEMQKHQPFRWIIKKNYNTKHFITKIENNSSIIISYEDKRTNEEALNEFTFADGISFGIKIDN